MAAVIMALAAVITLCIGIATNRVLARGVTDMVLARHSDDQRRLQVIRNKRRPLHRKKQQQKTGETTGM